jgi:hypothetical protein
MAMRKRRKNLLKVVTVLRQRGMMAKSIYYDYVSLILSAGTLDQLKEIALDFVEIYHCSQGRPGKGTLNRPAVLVMGDEALPIRRDATAWGVS